MTPRRIQLRRVKGWRMPENTVSVARPGPYGNPFKIAPAYESDGIRIPEVTAETAVQLFRERLERDLRTYPSVRSKLEGLRGRNVACWCAPDAPCHGDMWIEFANAPPGRFGTP